MNRSKLHLVFLAMASTAAAQNPAGQITGLVTDPSGAAVPGAAVEVVHIETGSRWQAATSTAGYYTVTLLPPGGYSVTARHQGFKSVSRSGITLVVAQTARIDFALEVGGVTETIAVRAEAPLLESQSAALGQIVESRVINDLPLNGRNYLALARLSAGVAEPRRGDVGSLGGSFVANGVRAQLNNYNLDGADNNTRIVDIQNRSHEVIQPSVDAVQEFKVETSNYSAEYGYSAGAVVNATIKSGRRVSSATSSAARPAGGSPATSCSSSVAGNGRSRTAALPSPPLCPPRLCGAAISPASARSSIRRQHEPTRPARPDSAAQRAGPFEQLHLESVADRPRPSDRQPG